MTKTLTGSALPDASIYRADPAYAALLKGKCDVYVPENALKPSRTWLGPAQYDGSQAVAAMAITKVDGKAVRGHTFYPIQADTSAGLHWWFDAITTATAQDLLVPYLEWLYRQFPGIRWWDVLNELFTGASGAGVDAQGYRRDSASLNLWLDAFGSGDDLLQCVFRTAARCTSAKLYYCDNSTEQMDDSWHTLHRSRQLAAIERARTAGVRIDGINAQAHLKAGATFIRWPDHLAAIKSMGLSLIIGELDVSGATSDAQAAATVAELLDHVRASGVTVDMVTTWGRSDRYSWLASKGETPLPYDAAMRPKPMAATLGLA